MHRFFVPPELIKITSIEVPLPKELAHQVRDVIRLDIGEQLLLLDNSGDEVLATVARINKASVEVYLLERRPGKREPAVRIILCQGMLKSTRFEWILEKGTELGVSVFSPYNLPSLNCWPGGHRFFKNPTLAAYHSGSSRAIRPLATPRTLTDSHDCGCSQRRLAGRPCNHAMGRRTIFNTPRCIEPYEPLYQKCRGDPCGRPVIPITRHNRPVIPNAHHNRPLHWALKVA